MKLKVFFLLLLTSSCAQFKLGEEKSDREKFQDDNIVNEVFENNISVKAVKDLAYTSYLKGCIDSKNYFLPKDRNSVFDQCREMAKMHGDEIEYIVTQDPEKAETTEDGK